MCLLVTCLSTGGQHIWKHVCVRVCDYAAKLFCAAPTSWGRHPASLKQVSCEAAQAHQSFSQCWSGGMQVLFDQAVKLNGSSSKALGKELLDAAGAGNCYVSIALLSVLMRQTINLVS